MNRLRSERGQAAVLTVFFLVVLCGAVALTLDVGSWFREQRATQSAADAAALAGAHALPDDTGEAGVLAEEYLAKNDGGDATVTFPDGTNAIRVRVERNTPGIFAQIFGIDSVDVAAQATARVGNPSSVRWAAPFAVDKQHPMLNCSPQPCWNTPTQVDLDKVGPGAFRLINIDGSHGGTGPSTLEDWILRGFDGYMPLNWYFSDPGAKFNSSHIKNALDVRIGEEMLFPVYDNVRGGGANFEYRVVGWVGYVVTSYTIKGSKDAALKGYFTKVIWEGILNEEAGPENFGVNSIELVE
jgi:Putative Flp pilus-assembly TadE/G-like